MPKTVLKMYQEGLRKDKAQSEKEEIRRFLYERKKNLLSELSKPKEPEAVLSAKQKRQDKKLKKAETSTPRKNSVSSSDEASESKQISAIPGFRSILEHLRRDRHCLLCPNLSIDSITNLGAAVASGPLMHSGDTVKRLGEGVDAPGVDQSTIQREASRSGDEVEPASCDSHTEDDEHLKADNAFCGAGGVLPLITCKDPLDNGDEIIRFTLEAENAQVQQIIVLSMPRFYYPDGLTKELVKEKLTAAMGRVFAEDEIVLATMSIVSNAVSTGQREGAKLNRELALESRNLHQQSHLQQVAQMKAVERDKSVRQWKRILHATGAAREKSQDLVSLAQRDVAILSGELKAKFCHRSAKSFQTKEDTVAGLDDA